MCESIKTLEIRTSRVFKLSFPINTILLCFFFSLIIIDFLILAVITQVFIPTAELVISTGTQTNEVNTETETQPATVKDGICKFST